MNNIFEKATRLKLRFTSRVGLLSTEDVWTLPLESTRTASLNEVAIAIHEDIERTGKKSFVTKNKKDEILELKMEIVKYIIEVRIKENKDAVVAANNRDRKELLMDVIAEKEVDELKDMSVKDLKKEIKSL